MERRRLNWFYIILFLLFVSCGQQKLKFDKEKWNIKDDIFYAYREKMVADLMENHLKKGMTYNEVAVLLGNSENDQSDPTNTLAYEISVDYGMNIDPQKGKTLYIEFTKDSTVKDFRLDEWKH